MREKDPFFEKLCFPGGGLELNEDLSDGIKREFKEETDYDVDFIHDLIPELTNDAKASTGFNVLFTNQIAPYQKVDIDLICNLDYLI